MAKPTWTRRAADAVPRSAARRERVSIDLRGHALALNAVARSRRIPVAALVRTILADWLRAQPISDVDPPDGAAPVGPRAACIKVTLRMSAGHAARLARDARAAELSQGAYVARLIADQAPMPGASDQRENREALIRSTAVLAGLSGDLQAVIRSLRIGSPAELQACRAAVTPLPETVRRHLALVAPLMAALSPSRGRVAGKDR